MRKSTTLPLIQVFLAMGLANADLDPSTGSTSSVVVGNADFDSKNLLAPEYRTATSGLSLVNPGRFSMHQSYSLSFASGGGGSASSGLYLNTLSYRLADPLVFSMDLGFFTPIYSTVQGATGKTPGLGTSLVLPRMGLEYRPSENFTLSLDLVNAADAFKAYGGPAFQPFRSRSR